MGKIDIFKVIPKKLLFPRNVDIYVYMGYSESRAFKNFDVLWWDMKVCPNMQSAVV